VKHAVATAQNAIQNATSDHKNLWPKQSIDTWFGGGARKEANFGGDIGFLSGPSFTPAELERVKAILHRRLVYNAYNLHGSAAAERLEAVPLSKYHTVCDTLNHGKMLTKTGRILPERDVEEMLGMSPFETFRKAVGSFTLADEDNIGHQQITMRAARPDKTEDVGFLHMDSWFWDYYDWPVPEGKNRTKVWVGIEVEPEANGLILVPGSHKQKYGFKATNLGNKIKFDPEFDPSTLEYTTFPGAPGETVVFNYGTLHVGKLNTAKATRVSMEFTLLY
jgi:Phytanoyl-CoA dioxygenase (PhyH)